MTIGGIDADTSYPRKFIGYIDDIQIYKGVTLYDDNFRL